jgi:hypothetical protein
MLMEKRKLKPKDILRDIRAGVDDATLMTRYALSAQALQSVFGKLVNAGMLSQAELDDRVPMADRTVDIGLYICPACGNIQGKEFTECPRCGFAPPGYVKKAKEPEPKEEPPKGTLKSKSQIINLKAAKKSAGAAEQSSGGSVKAGDESSGSVSDLLRIARYCRILGIATVVCYVLLLAAALIFTRMAMPAGILGFTESILALCALGIPVVATALLVLVTLKALSESLKVFARIADGR